MTTEGKNSATTRRTPEGVRILRFHTYRAASNSPRRWFKWHWNEYREVVTGDGVGVRIGGGLQLGRRMFSVRWRLL